MLKSIKKKSCKAREQPRRDLRRKYFKMKLCHFLVFAENSGFSLCLGFPPALLKIHCTFFIILFCILILIYILSMPFHKIFIEMSAAYDDAVKISCSISKTKRANVVESSSRWDVIFHSKKNQEDAAIHTFFPALF